MRMKVIETTVSETTVHMQLADDPDLEKAAAWIEFEVPLEPLMIDNLNKLGRPGRRVLAVIQVAALHHARTAINDQIHALSTRDD
jgi:hypothetical protein